MRTKTGTKRTMGRTMENNGNKEWNNDEQSMEQWEQCVGQYNSRWNNGKNVLDNRTVGGTKENNESEG